MNKRNEEAMMPQDEHAHNEIRKSSAVPGYNPAQSITRYELAGTLFSLLTSVEAASKQPKRTPRELKPGRKSNTAPNPKAAKSYSDVPAGHWAKSSIAALEARGIALTPSTTKPLFRGEQAVTGDELAQWADGAAGWVEGRLGAAKSLRELVQAGYLPQTAPLLKKSATGLSAQETTALLVTVIVRALEKITTTSPDSRYAR